MMIILAARFIVFLMVVVGIAYAQTSPIDQYIGYDDVQKIAGSSPRDIDQLKGILPMRKSQRFADYVEAKHSPLSFETLRKEVERLRLNKIIGNTVGGSGTTALVSAVAVPGILGFATEYGGILQNSGSNAATFRGNLLGLSRMVMGAEQFPYCPEIDQNNCQPASRWFRRFSGAISFESSVNNILEGTAVIEDDTVLLGGDSSGRGYRMASWGVRFDLTANDPDDPKFVSAWKKSIEKLRNDERALSLTKAASDLFSDPSSELVLDVYMDWQEAAVNALKDVPPDQFKEVLEEQLDILITLMRAHDRTFDARVNALSRAVVNYAGARDDLLREIQTHRLSAEYTNTHPINQPSTSNLRFIYSHQPTGAPLLITANFAMTWYNTVPSGLDAERFRDLQVSGQIDRRLGQIPSLGNAVLTLGVYYQWMKEDALITIGPGNVTPGGGIVLPGTAAKLLGTKGHIAVVQGKITIPVSNTIKVPVSATWSNRTELADEEDVRGQIGLTLDIDSLFK